MTDTNCRAFEVTELQEMSDAPTLIYMFVLGIIFTISMLFGGGNSRG